MILKSIQEGLESLIALNLAIEGNRDKKLTAEESAKNISDNIVLITRLYKTPEQNENKTVNLEVDETGSGMMITTDGWILTAYHNIENNIEEWKRLTNEKPPEIHPRLWLEDVAKNYIVVDQNKQGYVIDITTSAYDSLLDIALIKAITSEKPAPVKFRIAEKNLRGFGKIELVGMNNLTLYQKQGEITSTFSDAKIGNHTTGEITRIIYDTFVTDAQGMQGISGGVFINPKGELTGMANYAILENGNKYGDAGGAKIKNIVNFVKDIIYDKSRKIL